MRAVRFLHPSFPPVEEIAQDYQAILDRGIFSNSGPVERELAAEIAGWVGSGVRASVVANCTLGLELAIKATFDRSRRYALVASFTFPAGPLALSAAGFVPRWLDVDPLSWQPDLAHAERALCEHADDVGGILLTATFGVADERIAEWKQLAARPGLPLVLDSAAGFGAAYADGRPMGGRGRCEVFSLHATKMFAAGEGGVVTSRDAELIARLDRLKNFGFDEQRQAEAVGTNAKMPELTAAIALRQLARLPERIAARHALLQLYRDALEPLGLSFQPGAERSAPAFVSALTPAGLDRDRLRDALAAEGIESRDYYNPPVHRQPLFQPLFDSDEGPERAVLPETTAVSARMLSLPTSDDLPASVVAQVAGTVKRLTSNSDRSR